jgi:hypothetical protein
MEKSHKLHLGNMPSTKAGLTEAILLPYLALHDLIALASANSSWRQFFNPCSSKHVNFVNLLNSRFNFDGAILKEFLIELNHCETFFEIRKVLSKFTRMIKVEGQ